MVVGYAFSPLDLIPDFVPLLGYLDDLILLPIGIWVVLQLIPPDLLAECRLKVQERQARPSPSSPIAGVVIVMVWVVLGIAIAALLSQHLWPFRR